MLYLSLTEWIKHGKHRSVNVFKLETQTRHGMWQKVKLVESSEGGSRRGDFAKYSTAHQEHKERDQHYSKSIERVDYKGEGRFTVRVLSYLLVDKVFHLLHVLQAQHCVL